MHVRSAITALASHLTATAAALLAGYSRACAGAPSQHHSRIIAKNGAQAVEESRIALLQGAGLAYLANDRVPAAWDPWLAAHRADVNSFTVGTPVKLIMAGRGCSQPAAGFKDRVGTKNLARPVPGSQCTLRGGLTRTRTRNTARAPLPAATSASQGGDCVGDTTQHPQGAASMA